MRKLNWKRRWVFASAAAAGLMSAGCSLRESVIDGAYGGVSDTVAGVVSEMLLRLLGVAL